MDGVSPSDLEVLIHFHCCPTPHPRMHSPAVMSAVDKFVEAGILQESDEESGYATTERGRKFLDMILATPYPQHVWIDPREQKP